MPRYLASRVEACLVIVALLMALAQTTVAAAPLPAPPPPEAISTPSHAAPTPPRTAPMPPPAPEAYTEGGPVFRLPSITQNSQPPSIPSAEPAAADQILPINLATALYLSNARPLVIAFAQASVEEAAARLRGAQVLWLPNLNVGASYYRHLGTDQSTNGDVIVDDKTAVGAGGGATFNFALTDAIFRPLADRQELAARRLDLQAARNDALMEVAVAYFYVQQARGTLAGTLDAVAKGEVLVQRITGLAIGLAPPNEVDRAKALLFDLKQQAAVDRGNWRVASARLARLLRLNPGVVVVPLEPPHLQVDMFSPAARVADLVPVGLMNRPELASQRAVVQAAMDRVRQEQFRPFIPNVLVDGAGPGGALNGSVFGGGPDGTSQLYGGRFDMDAGLIWTLNNLGAGNRALVHQRMAQEQTASIAFANMQDQVAQEVVQAHAQLEAAAIQLQNAMTAVKEAAITYRGNLLGISETLAVGDVLRLINRPQEADAALQQLNRAYGIYYVAVNGYNIAQFRLYRALGFPARGVVCDHPVGQVQPVDTSRPPQMAPDCPHLLSQPCP